MDSVFVAGSRALSKLNAQVKERLDNILRKEFTVLVGDANGADKAVQGYLAERRYRHVFVYCMEVCRNNVGLLADGDRIPPTQLSSEIATTTESKIGLWRKMPVADSCSGTGLARELSQMVIKPS